MAQRVAICRAVLHRPELLLLDEPYAHLDPEASTLVEPLIGRGAGTTRVLVSHDVDRALAESDRVLGLRDGHVVVDSPAGEVTRGAIQAVYGGAR
jgi:ABC-type phosphate/phosphonate transport system ATPase subunit